MTNEWDDVAFISDIKNETNEFFYSDCITTNGFTKYIISNEETNNVFFAFMDYFNQMGIKASYMYKPNWVTPNHYEIYILQKPQ